MKNYKKWMLFSVLLLSLFSFTKGEANAGKVTFIYKAPDAFSGYPDSNEFGITIWGGLGLGTVIKNYEDGRTISPGEQTELTVHGVYPGYEYKFAVELFPSNASFAGKGNNLGTFSYVIEYDGFKETFYIDPSAISIVNRLFLPRDRIIEAPVITIR